MSWDFYIIDEFDNELINYELNYTYNVSPMYYKAFEHFGYTGGVRTLDQMNCQQAGYILMDVITYLIDERVSFMKLNPKNGWGDYSGALNVLKTLLKWCGEHPTLRLRVT